MGRPRVGFRKIKELIVCLKVFFSYKLRSEIFDVKQLSEDSAISREILRLSLSTQDYLVYKRKSQAIS